MGLLPLSLNARDQATVRSIVAFLEGRLEEKETIEWALDIGSGDIDIVKRRAILHLLDWPGGVNLREPWLSAWWLIRESWKEPNANLRMLEVEVKKRLHSKGERSEALVSAIVDLVAPRLSIKAYGKWQLQFRNLPKRPKTFHDLFQATLTSGRVIDPASLDLQTLAEGEFIVSLANALDAAIMRGLDIARRIGWRGEDLLLNRVYYVAESKRDVGLGEPDKYSQGIAPSVKLLYEVVSRLVDIDCSAALTFISRWKQTDSPIHWRLWAYMSRDPRITSASEVGDFLLSLDTEVFWNAYRHPEIAELRACRFSEFDEAIQKAITRRIRKGPSRNLWPKNETADRIKDYRLEWIVRELKRIEDTGATLPRRYETWLKSNIGRFPHLAEMNRVDKEDLSKAQSVPTTTDSPLDSLAGIDRLGVLEQTFPANQAWDWIKKGDNLERVLQDLESTPDGGAAFPKVWECCSLEHSPSAGPEQENDTRDLHAEARRVIDLLIKLPDEAISKAIKGISYWLSIWEKYIVAVPNWSAFWHRAWPLAVETTNAMQLPNEEIEQILKLPVPVRGFIDVFLAARPNLKEKPRPFDEPSDLGKIRSKVINTSGRSRLISKYEMIKSLEYFLHADKEWTKKYLIRPLLADDTEALAFWRAVSSSKKRFGDVLEFIGHDMINKTTDLRLDRERHSSLASKLVLESLHALWEGRDPAVPQGHVQQMVRLLDDEVRTYCAETITDFVSCHSKASAQESDPLSPEYLFRSAIQPFLEEVWPPERSLVSPGISGRFSSLPAITRGEFAEAVNAIERFLVPFDCWGMIDYGLYGDDAIEILKKFDGEKPKLAMIDDEAKAEALLRLLDRTIGTAENAVIPDDLGDALEQVRKVARNLARTPRYRRLETAARRARW